MKKSHNIKKIKYKLYTPSGTKVIERLNGSLLFDISGSYFANTGGHAPDVKIVVSIVTKKLNKSFELRTTS